MLQESFSEPVGIFLRGFLVLEMFEHPLFFVFLQRFECFLQSQILLVLRDRFLLTGKIARLLGSFEPLHEKVAFAHFMCEVAAQLLQLAHFGFVAVARTPLVDAALQKHRLVEC